MSVALIAENLGRDEREVKGKLSMLFKGVQWTEEEDKELIEMYEAGKSNYEISLVNNRHVAAIASRVITLKKEGKLQRDKNEEISENLPQLDDDIYFHEYYKNWMEAYKRNDVSPVTFQKYQTHYKNLRKYAPLLTLKQLNRTRYQKLINDFGEDHEKVTTSGFHVGIKSCILDALHEGELEKNPCYKISITGKKKKLKKHKFLGEEDLSRVLKMLDLSALNYDWIIYLAAMTGARFAEVIALTPKDFDFDDNTVSINKTWDYKLGTGFKPTKTKSSIRTIAVAPQVMMSVRPLLKDFIDIDNSIFYHLFPIYNSTINNKLFNLCTMAGVDMISFHSLRHSHASILLQNGVSTNLISKRLGHSKVSVTQDVYMHITKELEAKDNEIIAVKMGQLI